MKLRLRLAKKIWFLQFGVGLLVVLLGVCRNGGDRKYIPANPAALSSPCQKAYVNVHASSQDEPGAIICCDGTHHEWSWLIGSYEGGLCVPKPKWLPFAGRLTRFPDCWLLPLIPIFLRLVATSLPGVRKQRQAQGNEGGISSPTLRRLIMYILVMNFRGWVLYLFFNEVEDFVVGKLHLDWGLGTEVGYDATVLEESCWFKKMLKPRMQDKECYGRVFDFSDHIVLFFGHILSVCLFEVLFCFLFPFWPQNKPSATISQGELLPKEPDANSMNRLRLPSNFVPALLLFGFLYLDFVTFLAAYRTSAYFHTAAEIILGFAVSLLIQIPLGYIMFFEDWERIRSFVGFSPRRDD
uniref:Uncharacterized protein n=1 Tax=Odontella aurita TaxID=265563 RepID=A0A7S4N216_9STRA|mmetsp:Transcript_44777/g.136652  ORF Transcript_44777/g.136652 Transcript_44777/m.136652 type:complete len:353 (+) Transcript_44777:242-1300(+)